MAWIYLMTAIIFEITWPLGFKLSHHTSNHIFWLSISTVSIALSGYFLYLAQREIHIVLAYVTWTGSGAIGTFLIGILFFHDLSTFTSWLGLILIITGITCLKLAH